MSEKKNFMDGKVVCHGNSGMYRGKTSWTILTRCFFLETWSIAWSTASDFLMKKLQGFPLLEHPKASWTNLDFERSKGRGEHHEIVTLVRIFWKQKNGQSAGRT